MIEVLSRGSGKVFGMNVSGKLLHQDYERFVPMLEKLIQEHGAIRCLVEMTDLHGIELRALWDEIKFDVRHARQIERCAVVGDKAWEAWMTRLSRPIFLNAEIRFFDQSEREKAWEWIQEALSAQLSPALSI
jgi:SpoIIAA-like